MKEESKKRIQLRNDGIELEEGMKDKKKKKEK